MLKYETISHNGDATTTANVLYEKGLTLKEFVKLNTKGNSFRIKICIGKSFLSPGFELRKGEDEKWFFDLESCKLDIDYVQNELFSKKIVGEITYNGGYGQDTFWFELEE